MEDGDAVAGGRGEAGFPECGSVSAGGGLGDASPTGQSGVDAAVVGPGCMRERGLPYASMDAAREAVRRGYETAGGADEARRTEIRTAVADGACALAVGMPEVVDRVGRRHTGDLTARQRLDLNHAAELRAEALKRAREVTGDRP